MADGAGRWDRWLEGQEVGNRCSPDDRLVLLVLHGMANNVWYISSCISCLYCYIEHAQSTGLVQCIQMQYLVSAE